MQVVHMVRVFSVNPIVKVVIIPFVLLHVVRTFVLDFALPLLDSISLNAIIRMCFLKKAHNPFFFHEKKNNSILKK